MGNRLFQEARNFVNLAKSASAEEHDTVIPRAKNALVSAYANSTVAEKRQLRELQDELESLE
jgi:hypothetical protein